MSLITIIQGAADQLGLPRPTQAVSSAETQARQLVALAKAECESLRRRYKPEFLQTEATFTSVAASNQGAMGTLAPGFSRMISETVWDRTQQEPMHGPLNPQQWQRLRSSVVSGPYYRWRIQSGNLYLIPDPPAGHSMAFEYVSKNWAEDASGVSKATFTQDTDTPKFPEHIVQLGVVWRFKQAKGFSYAEDLQEYESQLANEISLDGGARALDACGYDWEVNPTIRAPEGSWTP